MRSHLREVYPVTTRRLDTYAVPSDVAWVDRVALDNAADALFLGRVPSGETAMLEGTARLVWLIATDPQRVESLERAVATSVGVNPDDVREDVLHFVSELAAKRYLRRVS